MLSSQRLWSLASQTLPAACAALTVVVQARALGAADFGTVTLAVTVALLIHTALFAGVSNAATRFLPHAQIQGAISRVLSGIRTMIVRRLMYCMALSIVLFPLCLWVLTPDHTALAIVLSLVLTFNALGDGILLGLGRRQSAAIAQMISGFGRLALSLIFCDLLGWGVTGALLASIGGGICAWSIFLTSLPKMSRLPAAGDSYASMELFSRPFLWWSIASWVALGAPRFFVNAQDGSSAVAHLAVAQLLVTPLALLGAAANSHATPGIFLLNDQSLLTAASLRRLCKIGIGLAVLGTSGALVLPPIIILMLPSMLGPQYADAAGLVAPLSCSAGFFAAGQFLATIPIARDPQLIMWPKIICPLGIAMASMAAIHWSGLLLATWLEAAGNLFYCMWIIRILRRQGDTGRG
jgi:O-antigen/teichoic acid export membrane protein